MTQFCRTFLRLPCSLGHVTNLPSLLTGVRPLSRLGGILPCPPPSHLLSWLSPSNKIIASLIPSWNLLFRRSRPIHLKTISTFILTGRLIGSRMEDRSNKIVFLIYPYPPPGATLFSLHSRISCFLQSFSPFPSGCGSFLLVSAEGLDLLHAVCGCAHCGKCLRDSQLNSLTWWHPGIFLTIQGHARLLCLEQVQGFQWWMSERMSLWRQLCLPPAIWSPVAPAWEFDTQEYWLVICFREIFCWFLWPPDHSFSLPHGILCSCLQCQCPWVWTLLLPHLFPFSQDMPFPSCTTHYHYHLCVDP